MRLKVAFFRIVSDKVELAALSGMVLRCHGSKAASGDTGPFLDDIVVAYPHSVVFGSRVRYPIRWGLVNRESVFRQ